VSSAGRRGSTRRNVARALGLAAGLAAAGCSATFTPLPLAPAPAPGPRAGPLRLAVSEEGWLQRANGTWGEFEYVGFGGAAVAALEESGWFADAASDVAGPPLEGSLVVRRYQGFMARGLLHVLSGFLIPVRTPRRIELELSLARPGEARRTCAEQGTLVVWHDLLLLPFMLSHAGSLREDRLTRVLALRCADALLSERVAAARP
jgi:hypothetical protein